MSIDEILAQADRAGLFASRPLQGCTSSEIDSLERRYGLTLPFDHRRFLELAGQESGLLFRWDHFAVSYQDVATMTEAEQARLREDGEAPLPPDASIIRGRLSEQFELIRAALGDTSPVWYRAEWAPSPRIQYSSFREWLIENLRGAIEVQASGIFSRHEGTWP